MSAADVEIVQRIYDAVARRDVETPFGLYDPEISWEMIGGEEQVGVDRVSHGHEGVRRFWRAWLDSFGVVDFDVLRLVEHGDEVVALIREHQRGRASGIALERVHLAVWTLHDGLVTRLRVYREPLEGLAELGLAPADVGLDQ
jgi:ketosteroid isomerase-like protein